MGDNARHHITVNNTIGGMCLDRVVARLGSKSQGRKAENRARFWRFRFHVDDGPGHLNGFDLFCDSKYSNSERLAELLCVLWKPHAYSFDYPNLMRHIICPL